MFNDLFLGIFLSLLLGALIGAQREIRQQKEHKKDFSGFRGFTFICLMGFLIGHLAFDILQNDWIVVISVFNVFLISAVAYYVLARANVKEFGATTEIVFVLTFVFGIFISLKYYQLAIALSILVTTILVLGNRLHAFAKHLNNDEVFATLKFAIISLVILPLLPNKNYSPLDIPFFGNFFLNQSLISLDLLANLDVFNVYKMWLMVVFISGIGFVGYILIKTIGAQKGIFVTGFLGGFMSSTALTTSFSQESRRHNFLSNPLVIGAIIACSTMFFRVIFEVAVLNSELLSGIIVSLGIMGLIGFVGALVIYFKHKGDKYSINKQNFTSPFTIGPALKFAVLYVGIMFFSKLFTLLNGDKGIYILSFISGITDVDAITISLSHLALDGSISNSVAQMGILIAAMSNTLFKGMVAYYFASKNFFMKIMFTFGVILFFGGLSFLF